jgi:Glycosyltransferase family 87
VIASPQSWSRPAEPAFAAVVAGLALLLFGLSWGLLHQGFYTRDQIVDTPVYEKYGDWMADGQVPYRDFRPEYPPLALPVFLVPSLAVGADAQHDRYRDAFEWTMAASGALLVLAVVWTLASLGAGGWRLAAAAGFVAVAPLALGSVVLTRFDLWPAALTAVALAAFVGGRDRLGAAGLGLATAVKLYPAVLVPLAAAWVWRRRGRGEAARTGAIFAAALALPYLLFLALGPAGVVESVERQLSRPLQIESLGAAALVAVDHLTGVLDLAMVGSHGSQNIAGTAGDVAGVVATVVQAAVLVGLWLAYWRGPQTGERLVRYSAAAVVAFVAFGKVLSPQFLVWLIPLVPLVAGRRGLVASGLLAGALVLTQLWFPFRYWDYADTFDEAVSWLVLGRDLVLVAALAVLVWPARGRSVSRAA